MTTPQRGGLPRHLGGARELLDHVADTANILAHRDARSVNDPRALRNNRAALLAPVPKVAGLLPLGHARCPIAHAERCPTSWTFLAAKKIFVRVRHDAMAMRLKPAKASSAPP